MTQAAKMSAEAHWLVRTALYQEAQHLAKDFRDQKRAILEHVRAALPASHLKRHSAPLVITAQGIGGALELVWRLEYWVKAKGSPKAERVSAIRGIRRTPEGFDLRSLLNAAHPAERRLVHETELAARALRKLWTMNVDLAQASRGIGAAVGPAQQASIDLIQSEAVSLSPVSPRPH